MTEIILVRHGQSLANLEHRFAGQSHFPLTETGFEQARRTAEYIVKNYKIDELYSSDLLRAFSTATPLATLLSVCPIKTDIGLREINAGNWEGHTWTELDDIYPVQAAVWKEKINECCLDGGETVKKMAERSRKAIIELAKLNDNKTICLVSHATVIRSFETFAQFGDLENMPDVPWPTNASVSIYTVDDGKIYPKVYSYDEFLGEYRQQTLMEGGK